MNSNLKKNITDILHDDNKIVENFKSSRLENEVKCSNNLKKISTNKLFKETNVSNILCPLNESLEKNDFPLTNEKFLELTNPRIIKKMCIENVKGWETLNEDDISVKQLFTGLTNQLFEVYIINEKKITKSIRERCAYRIYGKYIHELYKPSFELEVFRVMSKYKFAPLLLKAFEGGRIEQWLYGVALETDDLKNENILLKIAKLLGNFHSLVQRCPLPNHWDRTPCIYRRLEMWKNIVMSYKDLDLLPFDIYKYIQESDKFISFLKNYTKSDNIGNTIVFCHNDLQETNIMSYENDLCLIDFEYSDFNYLSIDLANFFNETTINYGVQEHPFFSINSNDYISYENRKLFVCEYLKYFLNEASLTFDNNTINDFLNAIEVHAMGVHLTWGFWGIIRAYQVKSNSDFDFILYGEGRFKMYDDQKKRLIKNKVIEDY